MKFFFSVEVQAEVADDFMRIQREIKQEIKKLEANDYGSEVKDIGIIPVVLDQSDVEEEYRWKERRLFRRKDGDADYRLYINFEKFLKADEYTKKLLIIKNIIESIRHLSTKAKKDFKVKKLEEDILTILSVTSEEIDSIDMY